MTEFTPAPVLDDAPLATIQRVLGIDACRHGWIGVALGADRPTAYFAAAIEVLVDKADHDGHVAVVAVDMPIGLPDVGSRRADALARNLDRAPRFLSVRSPTRSAFEAPDHASAVIANRPHGGAGISTQAYSLKAKLLQVDEWVRQTSDHVVEVHPEVSFARLAGDTLNVRKSTWTGSAQALVDS